MVEDEVRIPITSDADIIRARQEGRRLALQLRFRATEATLIATAISEVARNILSYAVEGEVVIGADNERSAPAVVVVARDRGPGIADLERAMEDGYSSRGGFGLGLPGARRLMDEFEIQSALGKGTVVTMRKWRSSHG